MAVSAIPFPVREAWNLRGRRVRLMQRLGSVPAGTNGEVVDQHPYSTGWVVEVRWDGLDPRSTINFEYFTKDDFIEYLVEC